MSLHDDQSQMRVDMELWNDISIFLTLVGEFCLEFRPSIGQLVEQQHVSSVNQCKESKQFENRPCSWTLSLTEAHAAERNGDTSVLSTSQQHGRCPLEWVNTGAYWSRCVEELKVNVLSIDQNKAFYLTVQDSVFNNARWEQFAPLALRSLNCHFGWNTWLKGKLVLTLYAALLH